MKYPKLQINIKKICKVKALTKAWANKLPPIGVRILRCMEELHATMIDIVDEPMNMELKERRDLRRRHYLTL